MTTAQQAEYHTLLDWNLMRNPDGGELEVARLMYQVNQFNKILPYREANDGMGHKIGIQTSLPVAYRSSYGKRQQAVHGTQAVITETSAWAQTPWKALHDICQLNGAGVELMKEAENHAEALAQLVEGDQLYGNNDADVEQPNGFMIRRSSLTGEIGKFTIDGGGAGDAGTLNLQSILLVGVGPGAVYGIFPKGSKTAGIETLEYPGPSPDYGPDGEVPMYKGRFSQHYGLAEEDHRYSVRIPNINLNGFGVSSSGNRNLLFLMEDALARVQARVRLKVGPQAVDHYWVMSNAMFREFLHEMKTDVSQGAGLRWENIDTSFGAKMRAPVFMGIPIVFSEQFIPEDPVS